MAHHMAVRPYYGVPLREMTGHGMPCRATACRVVQMACNGVPWRAMARHGVPRRGDDPAMAQHHGGNMTFHARSQHFMDGCSYEAFTNCRGLSSQYRDNVIDGYSGLYHGVLWH